jgi:hypothetical protein
MVDLVQNASSWEGTGAARNRLMAAPPGSGPLGQQPTVSRAVRGALYEEGFRVRSVNYEQYRAREVSRCLLIAGGGNWADSIAAPQHPLVCSNAIDGVRERVTAAVAADLRKSHRAGTITRGRSRVDRPWDAFTDDHLADGSPGIDKFMGLGFWQSRGRSFSGNLFEARSESRPSLRCSRSPSESRPEARNAVFDEVQLARAGSARAG